MTHRMTPFLLLLALAGCAAPGADPQLEARLVERIDGLERRLAAAEKARSAAPEAPAEDGRLKAVEQALAALKTDVASRAKADAERLATLEQAVGAVGGQVKVASLDDWGWHLRKDRQWVIIGDGQLKVTLDLKQPSVLVMSCNGHTVCEPGPGDHEFGVNPHHDKWLSVSFFVNGRNAPLKGGLREFHPPQLGWGQIHDHPEHAWDLLSSTQMANAPAGKVEVTLRAMQNSEKGTWRMHGVGMYVFAIPRAK